MTNQKPAPCKPCAFIPLAFRNHVFKVHPTMPLVTEIEQELGGVSGLLRRFAEDAWKVSDLVSLVHMMLHSAGKSVDYMALGNQMLDDGLEKYLPPAQKLLAHILRKSVPA